MRRLRRAAESDPLVDVPAEVDLGPRQAIFRESEDLGVAEAPPVDFGGLVGDEDLVTVLDQAHEVERRDRLGVGPAALEVGLAVEPRVGRAEEARSSATRRSTASRSPET